jgi:sugar transferase EpsL
VNGRNAIGLEERSSLDEWYVDNRSLRLDLKTIAMTMIKVLKREGVESADEERMARRELGKTND